MRIATVFISGPIGQDPIAGTRQALEVASHLLRRGYSPFVPHLCVFWELTNTMPYETWLAYDLAWLERCDALLRLPGASPGAEREVAAARTLGVPVFHSVSELEAAREQSL